MGCAGQQGLQQLHEQQNAQGKCWPAANWEGQSSDKGCSKDSKHPLLWPLQARSALRPPISLCLVTEHEVREVHDR